MNFIFLWQFLSHPEVAILGGIQSSIITDIIFFSLRTTELDSFMILLVMKELKSQFKIFSLHQWMEKLLGFPTRTIKWDFKYSHLSHVRKYGKLHESESIIFQVQWTPNIMPNVNLISFIQQEKAASDFVHFIYVTGNNVILIGGTLPPSLIFG